MSENWPEYKNVRKLPFHQGPVYRTISVGYGSKCQKIGNVDDALVLTRTIKLFLASDLISTNPSEYPVDFICKHGDLDMFKTFIKFADFDLDENQPILKNKLTPYAADHDNIPIATYLITKMNMEFRISLFENCMDQRDQKLPRFYKVESNWKEISLGCGEFKGGSLNFKEFPQSDNLLRKNLHLRNYITEAEIQMFMNLEIF